MQFIFKKVIFVAGKGMEAAFGTCICHVWGNNEEKFS